MRIISGIYGGRKLKSPESDIIRPTSDKVRGAVFNALMGRVEIENARVLDGFCGSGALGLEALSRGAAECLFIDSRRKSLALAQDNARMLEAEANFVSADMGALKPCDGAAYDLVFLDPPYGKGLALIALESLLAGGWLKEGAMCVVETESNCADVYPVAFTQEFEREYGAAKISFLRYNSL